MSWTQALRDVELTDEEVKGRICACPETGNPDEWGDGSSLPCMGPELDLDLTCRKYIYCIEKHTSMHLKQI